MFYSVHFGLFQSLIFYPYPGGVAPPDTPLFYPLPRRGCTLITNDRRDHNAVTITTCSSLVFFQIGIYGMNYSIPQMGEVRSTDRLSDIKGRISSGSVSTHFSWAFSHSGINRKSSVRSFLRSSLAVSGTSA